MNLNVSENIFENEKKKKKMKIKTKNTVSPFVFIAIVITSNTKKKKCIVQKVIIRLSMKGKPGSNIL